MNNVKLNLNIENIEFKSDGITLGKKLIIHKSDINFTSFNYDTWFFCYN
jgi:hypothetical protein